MPPLITTSLEMVSRADFRPFYHPDPTLIILQSKSPTVSFYRFLYGEVGRDWRWRDRLEWSDGQLASHLARPQTAIYVLYANGTPAGYIELDHQGESIEVAYFGLMSPFLRRGYGKHLLSFGVGQAWDWGAQRVWVHTCNLDSPHALATYQKCGFTIYAIQEEPMPEKYL